MAIVLLGLLVTTCSSLLGGLTGFGYAILASPSLLLLGLPPAQVVAVNLMLALFTRITVVYRWRAHIIWPRALILTLASFPGLGVGILIADSVDPSTLRWITGLITIVAAPTLLIHRLSRERLNRSFYLVSGFMGGVLATTTSLNGVPLALTLSSENTRRQSLIVDMAFYFVVSNIVAIGVLLLHSETENFKLALILWWLPGSLLANWLGTKLAPHLPTHLFKYLMPVLVVGAGVSTVLST